MRAKRAFTLIELLVVVGIIALLLAMLMPTINMLKEWRLRFHCQNNLAKIRAVVACYATKFNGLLPCGGTASWWESEDRYPGGTPLGRHLMIEALMGCGGRAEIFCCPAHPVFDTLKDDGGYYDVNVAGVGVRHKDVHGEGFNNWRTYEYNYAGATYLGNPTPWMKYYNMPGYGFFSYNTAVGRHPEHGTVMPNHWDTWRAFGKGSPATGRILAQRLDEQGNVPIAADEMRWSTSKSYFQGFWHFDDRETVSGDEDDRQLKAFGRGGGHTLYLSGAVDWFDWGDFCGESAPQYRSQGYDYFFGGLPEDMQ